jgi:hypothetical protein
MRENPYANGQFVEIVDTGVHFPSLECADIGSLQSALESQLFLGPAEQ